MKKKVDVDQTNDDVRQVIENILDQDDNTYFCCELLIRLTLSLEYEEWIENLCVKIILNDRNEDLCRLAITCLGHLARIHEKLIHKEEIVCLLCSLKEKNKFSGSIDDALDDINQFT